MVVLILWRLINFIDRNISCCSLKYTCTNIKGLLDYFSGLRCVQRNQLCYETSDNSDKKKSAKQLQRKCVGEWKSKRGKLRTSKGDVSKKRKYGGLIFGPFLEHSSDNWTWWKPGKDKNIADLVIIHHHHTNKRTPKLPRGPGKLK